MYHTQVHGALHTVGYLHSQSPELMNYLYLVFKLGRTGKTSRAPRMFRMEDTLSPTSPSTRFSALYSAVNCLGDIKKTIRNPLLHIYL